MVNYLRLQLPSMFNRKAVFCKKMLLLVLSLSVATKKAKSSQVKKGGQHTPGEIDMSHLTPAEKAKANRDRNREHARNTRLRKKAYLEKLKMTVDELCRERDTLVSERAGAANLLVEVHNMRTEVLMSFLALRSSYEKQRELWASILDESCFACVMPVTPYRSFPASEVQVSKCQRTILGIDGMMADTASLHVLLNSMIDRSKYPDAQIAFRYTLVTEDAVVANNTMMARWVMSTLNATQCGARMEVSKQGMLCCKFNSAHKIIGLELMFDVMAFMLQLKQAAGTETFSVVPNTVQTCQRSFDQPMVMTLAERPYTIVQVNKLWEEMTGFKAEDVVGKASCSILQGQATVRTKVEDFMYAVRFKRPASTVLLNYTKKGKQFKNYMTAYPLSTDSKITHYVALTGYVDKMDENKDTKGIADQAATGNTVRATSSSKNSKSNNSNTNDTTKSAQQQGSISSQQASTQMPHPTDVPGAGHGLSITGVANGLPSTASTARNVQQVNGASQKALQAPSHIMPHAAAVAFCNKPTMSVATLPGPSALGPLPPPPSPLDTAALTAAAATVGAAAAISAAGGKRPLEEAISNNTSSASSAKQARLNS
mmetsp:Transcript_27664/g.42323  ORF Transcript_27664/g.42323 Transcript_27664/m.42323 type:complete len:599 (+) Transcript_27664:1568-3364(+)